MRQEKRDPVVLRESVEYRMTFVSGMIRAAAQKGDSDYFIRLSRANDRLFRFYCGI